jgi:hypothetical protein
MSDAILRRYFVSRRFVSVALAASVLLGLTSPALAASPSRAAASQVVYNKSSKLGSLYVSAGLLPGHKYSLKITSKGHIAFTTTGFQNFVYVNHKHAIEDSRTLSLKGTTPYSITVKQPVAQSFRQWMMVMSVNLMARKKLTVKVVDLGKA